MKKLLFFMLTLNFVLAFGQLDKMPKIPQFENCLIENSVSTYNPTCKKDYNWFSYDLSKDIFCTLNGEFWTMYYRSQDDLQSLVNSLKEQINNRGGEIVLDMKNHFMFLYPAQNNKQYIVSLDFFNTNFRATVLKFTTDQLSEVMKNPETSETKFFTEKMKPYMIFYYDQKQFRFPQKYKNDLNNLALLLKKSKSTVYFFSYADPSEGGFTEAKKTGKNRLLSIKKLLNNAGVRNYQMVSVNRGTNQIYDKNSNGKEVWKNRRIEFFIKK